jgi:phage terminase large subunit-like protein
MAIVGPTSADVRDVMVEGESGILAMAPDWCMPSYLRTRRQLRWPNGALATLYMPPCLIGTSERFKFRAADSWRASA